LDIGVDDMTELSKAQNKLNRINQEIEMNANLIRKENELIPFGQPNIAGRRNIYANVQRMYEKERKLTEERQKQQERVEMLQKVEELKENNELLKDVHVVGKTHYASIGAKTSVNNLEYFEAKLVELEKLNEQAKAYNKTKPEIKMKTLGAEITKLKRKIEMLEDMKTKDENKVVSDYAQQLIDDGQVTQWKKKPIYYFVKGLRKVALEIGEDGNFKPSRRYPAYNDEDKAFVENLLCEC
jgi:hypothetical protein